MMGGACAHLVTYGLPLLLVVILAQQLDLVQGKFMQFWGGQPGGGLSLGIQHSGEGSLSIFRDPLEASWVPVPSHPWNKEH